MKQTFLQAQLSSLAQVLAMRWLKSLKKPEMKLLIQLQAQTAGGSF